MNFLEDYIRKGVEERGFRYVFDNRLDPVWPPKSPDDRSEQMEQIRQFAQNQGWSVNFTRQGRIAIFRKPKQNGKRPEANS